MEPTNSQIEAARDSIYMERVMDIHGWLPESFSEADPFILTQFAKAILDGDILRIGVIAETIVKTYNKVADYLAEERAAQDNQPDSDHEAHEVWKNCDERQGVCRD